MDTTAAGISADKTSRRSEYFAALVEAWHQNGKAA